MKEETSKSLSAEISYILRHNRNPGPGDFWSVIQRAYQAGRLEQAMEVNRRTAYEAAAITALMKNNLTLEDIDEMDSITDVAKEIANIMMEEELDLRSDETEMTGEVKDS